MPDYDEIGADDLQTAILPWTKLPFPTTVEEYEAGVNAWLDLAWGPEWRCPQCRNRFWLVLEAVGLRGALRWPVSETSASPGAYPAAPITCTRCRWIMLLHARGIFEDPPPVE
jgi:hypothetical protein